MLLCLFEDDEKLRWRGRETTGKLVSVLLAPCAGVSQVALDLLPLFYGRWMLTKGA